MIIVLEEDTTSIRFKLIKFHHLIMVAQLVKASSQVYIVDWINCFIRDGQKVTESDRYLEKTGEYNDRNTGL